MNKKEQQGSISLVEEKKTAKQAPLKRPRPIKSTALIDARDCRDELNLAEFPLAVLGDHVSADQKSIEFCDTIDDWKTGRVVVRRVCITGSDKYGLPTSKDEDILLALLQITRLGNDFTSPEVTFTKQQIIQILGWPKTGWSYQRIEESLHRWVGVTVHYFNAWRDKDRGSWRDSEANGVIEYVKLVGSQKGGTSRDFGPNESSRFIWNRAFYESFRSGYLKKLDFDLYRQLKRPAARRAYRFLDKRFWYKHCWEFPLKTFAFEKLGLSRAYDTGQLKARLQPALDELERSGFIEPTSYRKLARGQWTILVTKRANERTPKAEQNSRYSAIAALLIDRGVSKKSAYRLAAQYTEALVRAKLGLLDEIQRRPGGPSILNPAAFLVAAIRKETPTPTSHVNPTNERLPELGRPANAHSKTDSSKADFERYWQSLSVKCQAHLEQAAMASAKRTEVESLTRLRSTDSPLFQQLRDALVRAYLVKQGQSWTGADYPPMEH